MRRWLRLLDPTNHGLPEWVETVRPLSHLAPQCVTYDESSSNLVTYGVANGRVTLAAKEQLFRILRDGRFEYPPGGYQPKVGHGTIIGGKPFVLATIDGKRQVTPGRGGVHFERGVEIGMYTVVQKGVFGEFTEVGQEVMIDSFCHIGHGSRIGERAILTAGVILAGWVDIGEEAWLGIGARVRQFVKIGKGACVGAGAVVVADVPDCAIVYGVPARVHGYKEAR
jgi:acetyltransferase-like isoleucine patch superfamily enzyme